jgi:hypothetical protein
VTASRGDRRAGWAAEARGTRENMRGKFWIQKRQDLINEAEAILERAQVQGRELTLGEDKWFEQTKADIDFTVDGWPHTTSSGTQNSPRQAR